MLSESWGWFQEPRGCLNSSDGQCILVSTGSNDGCLRMCREVFKELVGIDMVSSGDPGCYLGTV